MNRAFTNMTETARELGHAAVPGRVRRLCRVGPGRGLHRVRSTTASTPAWPRVPSGTTRRDGMPRPRMAGTPRTSTSSTPPGRSARTSALAPTRARLRARRYDSDTRTHGPSGTPARARVRLEPRPRSRRDRDFRPQRLVPGRVRSSRSRPRRDLASRSGQAGPRLPGPNCHDDPSEGDGPGRSGHLARGSAGASGAG